MLAIAMIALFAATAPAEEIIEDLDTQEIVFSEECEDTLYSEEECLEEIAVEDLENAIYEEGDIESEIVFGEE